MPSSLLFGINNEGRVHTLSTTGAMWRELPYVGQEFKKLSALPHFLWALGGDHQIYVYVHGLDVPIRVREETYENERWLPIEGFSSRLLPTDRFHFSSMDGTVDRSLDKIRLPSMAWQWEGDWQLELTLNGQPLDHNGWMYGVDFPANYHPKKQWKSCVRRRLWVRSRRYSAMNSWCAIAPLHKDATSEPFIDVSVGGQLVAGADPGTMLVWAITSHNRVLFRTGVSTKSPEGARWNTVPVPLGSEIHQLSVGVTGLVWAGLLDGRALVRVGVTRDNLQGENWVEVRSPGTNLRIIQLSVGTNSVWAVTHDKQVWFRKGIKGEGAGISEELAVGCGWVEMVGSMAQINVSGNDQVFGVGTDDRVVYHRTQVTSSDLTGKRWKALRAPLQVSRASSNASLNRDKFHRSTNLLSRPSSMCEPLISSDWRDQSHSAPTAPTSLPVGDLSTKFEIQPKNPKAWSPVHSVGSVLGMEVHAETDESVWSESSRDSCIFAEDEELCWADYEAPWSWVEAGACTIESDKLPNWFAESGNCLNYSELDQPWRTKILEVLKGRTLAQDKFSHYEIAIDTSSWVHSGEARVSLGDGLFNECILRLEWVHTNGTLTILNPDGATTMNAFVLSDITCIQGCSEPGSPRFAIHVPRHTPSIVRLQFSSDALLEEWQTHLNTTIFKIHNTLGLPTDRYMWSDATGKQKRTKDQVKLLSVHWHWVSDWMVDFHVEGGADKDGWQYAVDFPAKYHGSKHFTDYVRRRRWYRRCAISTTGPWQELGHTKLLDVSLEPVKDDLDSVISVWALASGGQPMVRMSVTRSNPMGTTWEHVNSDQALSSISCGPYHRVWATGKKGCAYVRTGITQDTLEGDRWVCVEPPNGGQLKQISVNQIGVWAVDDQGRLHVRKEMTETVPEGTHWQTIVADPPVLNSAANTKGFKHVSVGRIGVWATTDGGAIVRREGICGNNPAGSGWDVGITGRWQQVCVRALS